MYATTGRFSAGRAISCVDVLQDREEKRSESAIEALSLRRRWCRVGGVDLSSASCAAPMFERARP